MERPLVPAAVLVAHGADLVVIGSAALVHHGELPWAHDVDVVPACTEGNLATLRRALDELAIDRRSVGPLAGRDVVRVVTSFGLIDVLVERGRLEFDGLQRRSHTAMVHGVRVAIACPEDAWRLRRAFKDAS